MTEKYRASLKDNIITLYVRDIPKKDFNFSFTIEEIDEIDEIKSVYGNPDFYLREFVNYKEKQATYEWINGTKDIDLRMRRIKANKEYEFSAFSGLCLDSAVRVVNKKYNTYKEDKCKEDSTYESFKFVDEPYKNVYIEKKK